ncbi:putative Trypanosome variant surface glycoprotein (A type) [Trypanosoma vivax]|nr:putative Trypanosome variant surface glycoprotein (A type) [Trypanosoma vivax]
MRRALLLLAVFALLAACAHGANKPVQKEDATAICGLIAAARAAGTRAQEAVDTQLRGTQDDAELLALMRAGEELASIHGAQGHSTSGLEAGMAHVQARMEKRAHAIATAVRAAVVTTAVASRVHELLAVAASIKGKSSGGNYGCMGTSGTTATIAGRSSDAQATLVGGVCNTLEKPQSAAKGRDALTDAANAMHGTGRTALQLNPGSSVTTSGECQLFTKADVQNRAQLTPRK